MNDRERAALLRRVHHHAHQARQALARRDADVVAAVAAGATQRQVADAGGLSHVGVAKIVRRMTADRVVDTPPPDLVNSATMFVITTPTDAG